MTITAAVQLFLAAAPSVTVAVQGQGQAPDVSQVSGIELRFTPVPNVPAPVQHPPDRPTEHLAAARKAYVNADFNRCLSEVSDDAALVTALGQSDRGTAARTLLWRVACNVGAGKLEPGRRAASLLAALKLQVPEEVGSVSPEVEAVIAQAYKQTSAAPPIPLEVRGTEDAVVELDGRNAGCSTPCVLEVPEGLHVVALWADGHEPSVRQVRVEKPRAVLVADLTPAAPELAAAQWSGRYRRAPDADGARSVKLLSTALRASRLVLLTVEPERMQGVLAIDGAVTARSERQGSDYEGLLRDLLVRGRVLEEAPPLYRRPLFWIAVLGAAAIAAGTTTAVLLTRRTQTSLSFR